MCKLFRTNSSLMWLLLKFAPYFIQVVKIYWYKKVSFSDISKQGQLPVFFYFLYYPPVKQRYSKRISESKKFYFEWFGFSLELTLFFCLFQGLIKFITFRENCELSILFINLSLLAINFYFMLQIYGLFK
jgi:hypothetical protein